MRELTIGVVAPRTGRLKKLGHVLGFVTDLVGPQIRSILHRVRGYEVRVVSRDSESQPDVSRRVTRELINQEKVHIVITLAGTHLVPVIAETCEKLQTPCLSSGLPWQVYYYGLAAANEQPPRWTYHLCWGLDDIANVFADMWDMVDNARTVGCLWNDSTQGSWLRNPTGGFLSTARSRGYTLIDPGGYREPATDFTSHIFSFIEQDITVVTSAATVSDLVLFRQQAAAHSLQPQLITCSRWLAYPSDTVDIAGIVTPVYWTPWHPYHSSLDNTCPTQLANTYQTTTGRQWLQPLGLAYALFEVATHALTTTVDAHDRRSLAHTLALTQLQTMIGPLDWTSGPVPNVAKVRLAAGQWRSGTRHRHHLHMVTNTGRVDPPVDRLQLLP